MVILEGATEQKTVREPEPTPPMDDEEPPQKPKPKPKSTASKRRPFDVGKLGALRKAGWPVAKIADEMQVSEATVYKYMKQEGIV